MFLQRWSGSLAVRALFWATWTFSFVMAVTPHPPHFQHEPGDKAQHIAAFATLTAIGTWAFPKLKGWKLVLWLSAFGALIEVIQAIPVLHRDCDFWDWVADTLAILAMMGLIALARWGTKRSS